MHFQKHGHQFGAVDAVDYEIMADDFMFGEMDTHTWQCQRPLQGSRLRFNTWNKKFGAASPVTPEFVKTFYVVSQRYVNSHGGEMAYFGWECGRINV
jgi:hypothetical protein